LDVYRLPNPMFFPTSLFYRFPLGCFLLFSFPPFKQSDLLCWRRLLPMCFVFPILQGHVSGSPCLSCAIIYLLPILFLFLSFAIVSFCTVLKQGLNRLLPSFFSTRQLSSSLVSLELAQSRRSASSDVRFFLVTPLPPPFAGRIYRFPQ